MKFWKLAARVSNMELAGVMTEAGLSPGKIATRLAGDSVSD